MAIPYALVGGSNAEDAEIVNIVSGTRTFRNELALSRSGKC
jgi:hypothetical protein